MLYIYFGAQEVFSMLTRPLQNKFTAVVFIRGMNSIQIRLYRFDLFVW